MTRATPSFALALALALFLGGNAGSWEQNPDEFGDADGFRLQPPVVQEDDFTTGYFAEQGAVESDPSIEAADQLPGQVISNVLDQPDGRPELAYTERTRNAAVRFQLFQPNRRIRNLPLGFTVGGWLDSGITASNRNPVNPPNAPTGGNLPVTFNYRNRQAQLNQLYGFLERPIDTSNQLFDIGGRIDLLFGEDYIFTQAVGLETRRNGNNHWNAAAGGKGIGGVGRYGLAMPQAYVETATGNWSTKMGHFYTLLGYETVTAPDNFFYSHAYTMQYGEPFTHTGSLTTWQATDRLTLMGGTTMGNDIFEAPVDRISLLTGANWTTLDNRKSISFSLTHGHEALPFGFGGLFTPMTIYSLVYVDRVTDWLMYVIQHDLGFQSRGSGITGQQGIQNAEWYGLNQYLITQLTDELSAGLRIEWFNDDDGARVVNFAGHWWEMTAGLNWEPMPGVRVRPELRWDWFDPHVNGTPPGPFDNNNKRSQFTAAIDTILIY